MLDCHRTESELAAGNLRGRAAPSKFGPVRANFDGATLPLKVPAAG